jgi:hypothetical protein
MNNYRNNSTWLGALAVAAIAAATPAHAVNVLWTDWQSGTPSAGTAAGQIVTPSTTVNVTYQNRSSYAFLQTGAGHFDYFRNDLGAANSPYTSSVVDNIPTAGEMIGLDRAGLQTLSFSETIANPFFAFVSLNGNGYAFDRDFDILSFGDPSDPEGPNYSGHWGFGTSQKVDLGPGAGTYRYLLTGTGEPHGVLRFKGAFDSITWESSSNEYWNGFTLGIQGTARDVFPAPDASATLPLMGLALGGLAMMRRRFSKTA